MFMRQLVFFSGSSHPQLAKSIATRLGLPLGKAELSEFSNGELRVEIGESVRDRDVFILQTFDPPNGHRRLMELLIMISACKTASAHKVTAVLPLFPYGKQPHGPYDRLPNIPTDVHNYDNEDEDYYYDENTSCINSENQGSTLENFNNGMPFIYEHSYSRPISPRPQMASDSCPSPSSYRPWRARSGKLVANLLVTAGADHLITLDLHDPQCQGFFDVPFDHLRFQPLLIKWIGDRMSSFKRPMVVSPDAGGAKRATAIAEALQIDFALIHKHRHQKNSNNFIQTSTRLIGEVQGRTVLIVDDLADTCHTLIKAANLCMSHGAERIIALVTHGLFATDQKALERLEKASCIGEIIVSNSLPMDKPLSMMPKVRVLDAAPLLAEAIRRIHYGESVSFLFDRVAI